MPLPLSHTTSLRAYSTVVGKFPQACWLPVQLSELQKGQEVYKAFQIECAQQLDNLSAEVLQISSERVLKGGGRGEETSCGVPTV